MTSKVQRHSVISIFPDEKTCESVGCRLSSLAKDVEHLAVYGDKALALLATSDELLEALEGCSADRTGENRIADARRAFSECVASCFPTAAEEGRYLIISPSTVPLDLACDEQGDWGERSIFSHIYSECTPPKEYLERTLFPRELPLQAYLLVCPMAMDRTVPRHLQDIVTVALALESHMPVELWLQPAFERARQALERSDLSWLHIDTHGTRRGIMLGPTRAGRDVANIEDLPARISVPFVMIIGCALTSGWDSIGSAMFARGVDAVFGPCTLFQSLGVTNSEEDEASWYRVLFNSLLDGLDVGTSLLKARRSVRGTGILKYAFLIVGSSHLRFQGGVA